MLAELGGLLQILDELRRQLFFQAVLQIFQLTFLARKILDGLRQFLLGGGGEARLIEKAIDDLLSLVLALDLLGRGQIVEEVFPQRFGGDFASQEELRPFDRQGVDANVIRRNQRHAPPMGFRADQRTEAVEHVQMNIAFQFVRLPLVDLPDLPVVRQGFGGAQYPEKR